MTDTTGRDWREAPIDLGEATTDECAELVAAPQSVLILPIGSTEPHGPHLPLSTDTILSIESARRSARMLRAADIAAVVAPPVPYGVTNYAAGFSGAISLAADVVEQIVTQLCIGYREAGFGLVCIVNHHLEPDHVSAISRAVASAAAKCSPVIFANQLTPRWGRTLSAEFKRGDCHAGSYETSLVLAAQPALVRDDIRALLPPVPISLATGIRAGQKTFAEMGIDRAYSGTPSDASALEGDTLYARLSAMIVSEVNEALGLAKRP